MIHASRAAGLLLLAAVACSKSSTDGEGEQVSAPRPGQPGCYTTANLTPCPADPSDPSGQGLPTPGADCSLAECAVCGSADAPAFRDAKGTPGPGYCICVARSGGNGNVYSCFAPEDWRQQ